MDDFPGNSAFNRWGNIKRKKLQKKVGGPIR